MQFSYFDAHSHVQDRQFHHDRDAVLTRMKEGGVGALVAGADMQMNEDGVALVGSREGLWATVGIHPVEGLTEMEKAVGETGEVLEAPLRRLRALAQKPKVAGIGECGLDYFYKPKAEAFEKQAVLFRAQITLARELALPLMVHIRPTKGSRDDAYLDALPILDEFPGVKGNIHFFAGTWTVAQEFLARGFTLSFTGVITFARDYDEVIKNMPLDMMLSETDCPYVAPAPYRGKRNEPAYVEEVVKKMAEIRGESLETVRHATVVNALRVFKIPGTI